VRHQVTPSEAPGDLVRHQVRPGETY